MDDQRKGRYDGFWSEDNGKEEQRSERESREVNDEEIQNTRDREDRGEGNGREEGSSYYYSYGPFKQGQEPQRDAQSIHSDYAASERREDSKDSGVVVTPPRQLRPFVPASGAGKGEWQQNGGGRGPGRKGGGGMRTAAVSFLAGVIAVGVLMWQADVNNWFTKGSAISSGIIPARAKAAMSAKYLRQPTRRILSTSRKSRSKLHRQSS